MDKQTATALLALYRLDPQLVKWDVLELAYLTLLLRRAA